MLAEPVLDGVPLIRLAVLGRVRVRVRVRIRVRVRFRVRVRVGVRPMCILPASPPAPP